MKPLIALGVAVAAILFAVEGNSTAATDTAPLSYNSGNSSERGTSMLIGRVYPYPKTNIYCVDLGTLPQVGETLLASSDVEVTNDVGYKVYFNTQIVLADSCTADTGTEITEANGYNLTYDMHHGVASKSGILTVTTPTARHYVLLQAYAKGLSTKWRSGDRLTVESDFGRLAVLRW